MECHISLKAIISKDLFPVSLIWQYQTVKVFNKNTGSSQQYYFTEEIYVDYIDISLHPVTFSSTLTIISLMPTSELY